MIEWRKLADRQEFRWVVLAFFGALILGLLVTGQISSGKGIFLCSMFVCLATVAILLPRSPVDLEAIFGAPVSPLVVVEDRVSGTDLETGQLRHVNRADIVDVLITQIPYARRGENQVSVRINTVEISLTHGRSAFLVPATDEDLTALILRLRKWSTSIS